MPSKKKSELPPEDYYHELFNEFFRELMAFQSRIPGLERKRRRPRTLKGHRTVRRDFIRAMVGAARNNQELRRVALYDVDAAADKLAYFDELRGFRTAVAGFLATVDGALERTHGELAEEALHAYAVLKALSRRETAPKASLQTLKKALKRGRKHGAPTGTS